MSSKGQDVRKMVERLQRRQGELEQVVIYQQRKIRQQEALLTAQGIEIDTAQRAILQWMSLSGEHWAALRQEVVGLRTAGMACQALFAGWGEAFAHLLPPPVAEDVEAVLSPFAVADDEDEALPTPIGGDNAGAVL